MYKSNFHEIWHGCSASVPIKWWLFTSERSTSKFKIICFELPISQSDDKSQRWPHVSIRPLAQSRSTDLGQVIAVARSDFELNITVHTAAYLQCHVFGRLSGKSYAHEHFRHDTQRASVYLRQLVFLLKAGYSISASFSRPERAFLSVHNIIWVPAFLRIRGSLGCFRLDNNNNK